MAMTVAEADAVSNLVRFIVSGELYTGQPESAAKTAAKLVYLAARAEKILQLNLPGDEATYAARLEALSPQGDLPQRIPGATLAACRHSDSLYGRCADCGMTWKEQAEQATAPESTTKPGAADDLRIAALKEIDEIHIEWGQTPMTEANVVALHERLGAVLRKAGV